MEYVISTNLRMTESKRLLPSAPLAEANTAAKPAAAAEAEDNG